jgi:hypothetical protein
MIECLVDGKLAVGYPWYHRTDIFVRHSSSSEGAAAPPTTPYPWRVTTSRTRYEVEGRAIFEFTSFSWTDPFDYGVTHVLTRDDIHRALQRVAVWPAAIWSSLQSLRKALRRVPVTHRPDSRWIEAAEAAAAMATIFNWRYYNMCKLL